MITVVARILYRSGNSIDVTFKAESEASLPNFTAENAPPKDGGSRLTSIDLHDGCSVMPTPNFFGLSNIEAIYTLSDSRLEDDEPKYDMNV